MTVFEQWKNSLSISDLQIWARFDFDCQYCPLCNSCEYQITANPQDKCLCENEKEFYDALMLEVRE